MFFFSSLFIAFILISHFVLPAAEHKCLKRGVKEVVKSIRRGHKGSVFCEIPLLIVGFSRFKSMKGA